MRRQARWRKTLPAPKGAMFCPANGEDICTVLQAEKYLQASLGVQMLGQGYVLCASPARMHAPANL